MPAATITTSRAHLSLLQWESSETGLVNIGVLIEDPSTDRLYLRLRRDWDDFAAEEADVLSELETDLTAKSSEMGAAKLLASLEDTLSNSLRISDRRPVMVEDFDRALARSYRQHVQATVRPFVTHIPRYSLAAAAGKFRDNEEITVEGWEETPEQTRLTPDMFAAHITGRSMEPRIPDGSLCLFRSFGAGSREGKLVLVEEMGRGSGDRYTVKRYHSAKVQLPDGTWAHDRIRLEALNPEFESWNLAPEEDRFRVIAEFVQVLD